MAVSEVKGLSQNRRIGRAETGIKARVGAEKYRHRDAA